MRRSYFVFTFIATHIFFIFFQIHKHSKIIRLSYQKQKHEQKRERFTQRIQELTQQLYEMKKRSSIKAFAHSKLGMKKIRLSQIKKLNRDAPEATAQ